MSKPSKYLTVKDHSVSGESFDLLLNDELQLLETQPRPSEDVLGSYYQTEDYISHTDSKRNVFEYLYHFVRSIALKRKIRLVNSFGYNKRSLLDIGCGTGDFLHVTNTALHRCRNALQGSARYIQARLLALSSFLWIWRSSSQ